LLKKPKYSVPGINPHSANVENMVSSILCQQYAGGNLLGV